MTKDVTKQVNSDIEPITDKSLARFGCMHCEWKLSDKCPCYDPKLIENSNGEVINFNYPKEGICTDRVNWLSSFLPRYQSEPSNSQVMLDLLKGLGHKRHLSDTEDLAKLELLVADLESRPDPTIPEQLAIRQKRINRLHSMIAYKRSVLEKTWRELLKIEDNQVDRETIKKSEVTTKLISPMDIAEWIEDAEYKEVDGE